MVTGALWSGAAYMTGGSEEEGMHPSSLQANQQNLALDPNGKGITYEDVVLQKSISLYQKDEAFLSKYVDLFTKLEKKI